MEVLRCHRLTRAIKCSGLDAPDLGVTASHHGEEISLCGLMVHMVE